MHIIVIRICGYLVNDRNYKQGVHVL